MFDVFDVPFKQDMNKQKRKERKKGGDDLKLTLNASRQRLAFEIVRG